MISVILSMYNILISQVDETMVTLNIDKRVNLPYGIKACASFFSNADNILK